MYREPGRIWSVSEGAGGGKGEERTLVTDLKNRPHHLVLLLAVVRGVLGVLHLVAELEQRVFDVVEARWRGFARARRADGRHAGVQGGTDDGRRRVV